MSDDPADVFTERDRVYPVYCTECRQQIPEAVSMAQGVCNACRASRQQAATAREALATAERTRQVEAHRALPQPVRPTGAGTGVCPACGAWDVRVEEGGKSPGGFGYCCLFVALFPLSLIALPFVARRKGGVPHRLCRVCGHRWAL